MSSRPVSKAAFVLCQIIFVCGFVAIRPVYSQPSDTTKERPTSKADSIQRTAFQPTGTVIFGSRPRRSIDLALTGGAGTYNNGTITAFQPTANADFFAQTSELDLTAGFHWGFSNPSTKAITLGLRFPIMQSEDGASGFFADAALLFIDNGSDTDAFSTGLRAALAARTGAFECRLAGEIRTFPFGGNTFEGWAGLEAGFVLNLLREESTEPTPKDSLRAELRYIATSAEMDALDKASSSEEIDRWLDRFWQARNVTGSARNEAREEYMRRVRIANEKYGTPRKMGVTTDQGRVLLLYGQPDHLETANSLVYGADRKYELWIDENRVHGHQTALFLFVSSQLSAARGTYEGHGDYREVYSNLPGEPSEGLPSDLPSNMLSYIEGFR
jgi:GWxTD domain-containing protein